MDYPAGHITLPVLGEDRFNYRDFVENFIVELLLNEFPNTFTVQKYYKTANVEIYQDCSNKVQSGVPVYFIRTTREQTEEANPEELADNVTCSIEVIIACSTHIEKGIKNVNRYVYTMDRLLRNLLRGNFLTGIPRNRRRPFVYLGNRSIFRDDDLDILLAEYNVNYIAIQ